MLNIEQAKELALQELMVIERRSKIKVVLLEDATISFEFGWVFFYQSDEYIRTGNPGALLSGNAPILIDKYDGTVHVTGTARDIKYYIDGYSKSRKPDIPE